MASYLSLSFQDYQAAFSMGVRLVYNLEVTPIRIMNTLPHHQLHLVTIDLSFHVVAAQLVKRTLERHGYAVQEKHLPHVEAFEVLARREADLLCAAWLPGSHGEYFEPLAGQCVRIVEMYEPYAFWGVPDYVPLDMVSEVADLRKQEVANRMRKVIQGIGPGAGISRFSREIIAAYRLQELGYTFKNGTLRDCMSAFEDAYAQRMWCVIPLWHPQSLNWRYNIRELAEPQGLLRGKDAATLVAWGEVVEKLSREACEDLKALHLGNQVMTFLDWLWMASLDFRLK